MINSVCGIGSTGRICTDLAETLSQNGHEVKIAYGRGDVPDNFKHYAIKIGNDFDVKLHVLYSRIFDNTGFGSYKATKKFLEWVKEYNPDVIHLHNIHGYYINIELLFDYLAKAKKRVIWTLHDCWAFTGHCPHFSFVKCDKWKYGCSNCPQKRGYPSSYVFDSSCLNWKRKKKIFTSVSNMTLITPSEWLAKLVRKSFLGKYPIKVINNGIDTDVFKPTLGNFRQNHNLMNKKILLGVSNQWTERKGLNDFIKLSSMISDDYRIVLVGLSDKQISSLPNNKIIGIRRTQSTKELAEIYTMADVFLNLSYEESFGLTTIEAISCGTAVIVYDTTALSEITPQCKIQEGNLDKIVHILKKQVKKCAFEKKYSKNMMIESYMNTYTQYEWSD